MGQLNSMKEIVDGAKKDNDDKENLMGRENKEMERNLATQAQKITGDTLYNLISCTQARASGRKVMKTV